MKQKKLNTIRLPFYTNSSVGGLEKESKLIFDLSGDYIYLVCSDGCEYPYDDELIRHKLDYYFDKENYIPNRGSYYLSYFKDFIPNFERVFTSSFYQKYKIPDDYTIFKVYDVKTLNFFLSVSNEEEIDIFSSDYDILFLTSYLNDYYKDVSKYSSKRVYLLEKYREYITSKKFIFYDIYSEDELEKYLLISSEYSIIETIKNGL